MQTVGDGDGVWSKEEADGNHRLRKESNWTCNDECAPQYRMNHAHGNSESGGDLVRASEIVQAMGTPLYRSSDLS